MAHLGRIFTPLPKPTQVPTAVGLRDVASEVVDQFGEVPVAVYAGREPRAIPHVKQVLMSTVRPLTACTASPVVFHLAKPPPVVL